MGSFSSARRTLLSIGSLLREVLPYTIVHDFETTAGSPSAGHALSLDTTSRHVLNTSGLRITGNSTTIGFAVNTIKTFTEDMASWDTIAICVDLGTGYESPLGDMRVRFTSSSIIYDYRADTASGVALTFPFKAESQGKRWLSYKVADFKQTDYNGASVKSLGAASKILAVTSNSNVNGAADIVFDALVLPAFHKPAFLLTFDDGILTQYTNAFPVMAARGIPGTIYIPSTSKQMTYTQLAEMRAAGWAMAIDSEASDAPFSAPATLVDAITKLNENKAAIITGFAAIGVDVSRDAALNHVCLSYGSLGYSPAPVVATNCATTTGSTTISTGSVAAYSTVMAGLRVTGPGIPADAYVIKPLTGSTAQISIAATATSTTATLRFTAAVKGLTATCIGTGAITLSSTTDLFVGMHMIGYTVLTDTRITSIISGTQIMVDKNVPASCTKANFGYVDGEFWPAKAQNAILAAGYKTARRVASSGFGGLYTGYGIDPLAAVDLPAIGLSDPPTAAQNAQIISLLNSRNDVIAYCHNVNNPAGLITLLDQIATMVSAGQCEALNMATWLTKVNARLPIS